MNTEKLFKIKKERRPDNNYPMKERTYFLIYLSIPKKEMSNDLIELANWEIKCCDSEKEAKDTIKKYPLFLITSMLQQMQWETTQNMLDRISPAFKDFYETIKIFSNRGFRMAKI